MAKNLVLTYLHFRILDFPLILPVGSLFLKYRGQIWLPDLSGSQVPLGAPWKSFRLWGYHIWGGTSIYHGLYQLLRPIWTWLRVKLKCLKFRWLKGSNRGNSRFLRPDFQDMDAWTELELASIRDVQSTAFLEVVPAWFGGFLIWLFGSHKIKHPTWNMLPNMLQLCVYSI